MYGMTETSPLTFQSLPSDTVQETASTVGVVTDHMEVGVMGAITVAWNYSVFRRNIDHFADTLIFYNTYTGLGYGYE
jgi:hypothetical protein